MSFEQRGCRAERRYNDLFVALNTDLQVGEPNVGPGFQLLRDSYVFQIFYIDLDSSRNNLACRCLVALSLLVHREKPDVIDS